MRVTGGMTSEVRPGAVLDAAKSASSDATSVLREFVELTTTSGEVGNMASISRHLGDAYRAMGFQVEHSADAAGGPIMEATRQGRPGYQRLLILGHLDTVRATERRDGPIFSSAGDDLCRGPGVADMKGGLIVALNVVRTLSHLDALDCYSIHVLHNSDEEQGSPNSRALIEQAARGADLSLVFEPARPDGSLVTSRRGLRRYRIAVQGRAAHSGVDPGRGASAISALARKITAIDGLVDPERDLSVNVGVISGGTGPNTVAARATAEVDVRIADMAVAEAVHEALSAIVERSDLAGTAATYEIFAERPPLVYDDRLAPLLDAYRDVAHEIGIPLSTTATGGGSDGNFTAAMGVPTLDGLGPVGGGYHTPAEFIRTSSLAERTALTAAALIHHAERVPPDGARS